MLSCGGTCVDSVDTRGNSNIEIQRRWRWKIYGGPGEWPISVEILSKHERYCHISSNSFTSTACCLLRYTNTFLLFWTHCISWYLFFVFVWRWYQFVFPLHYISNIILFFFSCVLGLKNMICSMSRSGYIIILMIWLKFCFFSLCLCQSEYEYVLYKARNREDTDPIANYIFGPNKNKLSCLLYGTTNFVNKIL